MLDGKENKNINCNGIIYIYAIDAMKKKLYVS